MRDFFIRSFERLIGVIIVLSVLAVIITAISAATAAPTGGQGLLAFLAVLLFGTVYVILVGGLMYLALGIYHNTMRAANALDRSGSHT